LLHLAHAAAADVTRLVGWFFFRFGPRANCERPRVASSDVPEQPAPKTRDQAL
jgi:hypothetical protein